MTFTIENGTNLIIAHMTAEDAAVETGAELFTSEAELSELAASWPDARLMLHPDVPSAARIRAASCVMQLSHKSIEEEDLEVRIAALEAAIGQK